MFPFFDDTILDNRILENHWRHSNNTWGAMVMTKIFHLGHVVSTQVGQYKLEDDMIYSIDDIYSMLDSKHREMITWMIHNTLLAWNLGDLYDFEAPQRVEPLYMRVSKLPASFEYIFRSEDRRFLYAAG
jgi:hypothetical protein